MRRCTSLAPALYSMSTSLRVVLPRTMESSTTTSRLPSMTARMRVELHADAELAQVVVGLDEGAVHVAVLDEALGVGDAGVAGVADGRRDAGVGHRDDESASTGASMARWRPISKRQSAQGAAVEARVGPREVDELEDAHGGARAGQLDAIAAHLAVARRPDDLARLDLAHELGADDVEGARLAGDDRVALEVAQAERSHAEGVAKADHLLAGQHRRREGAADTAHGLADGAQQVAEACWAMSAVITSVSVPRLEVDALAAQLVAQLGRVDQVAVVGQGDRVLAARARERLRVLPGGSAGGGVAHVADGVLPVRPASTVSSKTCETRPMSLTTVTWPSSATAMPALS